MSRNNFYSPSANTINQLNSRNQPSNFNNAFTPSQNMIPRMDYTNTNELVHNNVAPSIINEFVTEYSLHIESEDRDDRAYVNPFNFIVSLGGSGVSKETNHFRGNRVTVSTDVNRSYGGNPEPRIERSFKNVKYVKLKYLILPRLYKYNLNYTNDPSGNPTIRTYSTINNGNSGTFLGDYRYLLLRVKELESQRSYSTGNNLRNECFILIRDKSGIDAISDLWIATQPTKVFYNSVLRSLTKLTLELLDPSGNQIFMKCIDQTNNNTLENIPLGDINAPNTLTSNFGIYANSVSMSMEFELGVCESEIDINKGYH
jgi:hypothetical protein